MRDESEIVAMVQMSSRRKNWPVARLTEQLCDLGVTTGDRLFVHTGLRPLRLLRRDVPNLLRAYLTALGPEGALFFPAHTYSYKGEGNPIFSADAPCHRLVGAWPELARQTPGAARSLHPTHSVCGIGAGVHEVLQGHERTEAAGFGSLLDKLQQLGGKVLLAGCGFDSCTLVHLAETYARVPYLTLAQHGITPIALAYRGRRVTAMPQREMPGCSEGFPKLEPMLRSRGIIRDGSLAEGRAMLCEMRTMLNATLELLRADPFALLCDEGCPTCDTARRAGV